MTTSALITMIAVQLLVTIATAIFMTKVLRKDSSGRNKKSAQNHNHLQP